MKYETGDIVLVSYQRINSLACSKGCQALNIRLADNQPFRSNSALRAQLTYQILPGEGFIPRTRYLIVKVRQIDYTAKERKRQLKFQFLPRMNSWASLK